MRQAWKQVSFILGLLALVALVTLALGCSSDKLERKQGGAGTIWGSIDYQGDKVVQKIGIAVFDSPTFPPVTAPVRAISVQEEPVLAGVQFPVDYLVDGLSPGDYWMVVFGDTDVEEGYHMPSGDDPATGMVGPITVPLGDSGVQHDVELADGAWNLPEEDTLPADGSALDTLDGDLPLDLVEGELTPEEGRAALFGTISYEGELRGKLFVIGFPEAEFGMPSLIISYYDPGTYPFDYQKLDVKPGTYYVMSMINLDLNNAWTPGEPYSGDLVELKLVAGQVKRLDFTLVDSDDLL